MQGIEDLVVDDGAVGTVQGHPHGLRLCGRAAGALVLHVLRVNGVQGFAGTFALTVMDVHYLLGLTVPHFDVLQPGRDVLAFRLLACVTAGARNFQDFPLRK